MNCFYLGTHHPDWLALSKWPLFVSHRRMAKRRGLPRAACRWALDSGGFTELKMFGRWQTTPRAYMAAAKRYRDEIGLLDWAAPQDWMCEPFMLARTGKSISQHQALTVQSYLELRALAPDLPFAPVLQGWTLADYHRCIDMYERGGVDLWACPIVGLGSVCRRQSTVEIGAIVDSLAGVGLMLHGFGVKMSGLSRYSACLVSADSMAWSYAARREDPLPGHAHKNCANCREYAEGWRGRLLAKVEAA